MRAWRDASSIPTVAEVQALKAEGVHGIAGYFKFGNDGIYNGWPNSAFQMIIDQGLDTLAFVSGWAPPSQVRSRAEWLGIQTFVDVERGIRDAGMWMQDFCIAANCGLYGNAYVHPGVTAPKGHIYAGYFGYDPRATWPAWVPKPNGPWGWQFQGTHNDGGLSVDSDWFDDAIGRVINSPSPVGIQEALKMVYVSANLHPLAVNVATYVDGAKYRDPFALLPVTGLPKGSKVDVVGYVFSSDAVQSTIPAGADHVWWKLTDGLWVPDAVLDTSALAGAPGMDIPSAESLVLYGVSAPAVTDTHIIDLIKANGTGVTDTHIEAIASLVVNKLPPIPTEADIVAAIAKHVKLQVQ